MSVSFSESIYQAAPVWMQNVLLNVYASGIERHRYGDACRQAVGRLLERERWDRERLDEFQDARLREIVSLAFARSSYYRDLMAGLGLKPADIRSTRDLQRLPLLPKEVVRERAAELMTESRPRRDWLHGHTSGTTGSPLGLWYDRQLCIENNALDLRQKLWGGKADEDWIGLFLGRVIVPTTQHSPPFWRVNRVQRQVWFSCFHMNEDNLRSYTDEILRRGLQFLEGYPSTIYILATHLLRTGTRLPMRAVFTSSETLHQIQRDAIEQAFECRLFDFYGLAERSIFASECEEHGGKHLAEDFGFTEVVDEEGSPVAEGESGYLVGTSLHNRAMPMIRYRTTDISRIEVDQCGCGRTLRRIADISTKAEDIVMTPDGRMVSPSVLTHPFKPFDQIAKSQIVQHEIDRISIKIVPSTRFTREDGAQLLDALRARLGEEVRLELDIVEDIPREASGKFRWVISHVDHANLVSWDATSED